MVHLNGRSLHLQVIPCSPAIWAAILTEESGDGTMAVTFSAPAVSLAEGRTLAEKALREKFGTDRATFTLPALADTDGLTLAY